MILLGNIHSFKENFEVIDFKEMKDIFVLRNFTVVLLAI
jgi:hypothetical protein